LEPRTITRPHHTPRPEAQPQPQPQNQASNTTFVFNITADASIDDIKNHFVACFEALTKLRGATRSRAKTTPTAESNPPAPKRQARPKSASIPAPVPLPAADAATVSEPPSSNLVVVQPADLDPAKFKAPVRVQFENLKTPKRPIEAVTREEFTQRKEAKIVNIDSDDYAQFLAFKKFSAIPRAETSELPDYLKRCLSSPSSSAGSPPPGNTPSPTPPVSPDQASTAEPNPTEAD
jgi:hypothetical protein